MMRRRYWIILVVIPLLLLVADVVYWQIVTRQLRHGLQQWIEAERAQGWEVETGPLAMTGWPQAASVVVHDLSLRHAGPDMPGDISLAGAEIDLSLPLYQPTMLLITLTGPQHVRLGSLPDTIVTGDQLTASVGLLPATPRLVVLRGRTLRLEPADGGWHLTIGLLNADASIDPAAGRSKPAVGFSLSTEAIALPGTVKWALGANISSLAAEGVLNGPLPDVPDMTGWAQAWRDGGGSLELAHVAMGWGPLGVTGSAKLALDEQLQPTGSGSATLVGYADTLDRLAAGGVLSRSAAMAAKAVLSLMAGSADADQPASVEVPLTLQYRTLSMRQLPLLRIPELDWPPR